jgi:FMN phosphatase YigB (HAD superfamily)
MKPVVDWNEIDGVVFDLDGTLYDQRRLRLRLAAAMAWQMVGGSLRAAEFTTIMRFRACRERWSGCGQSDLATGQYEFAAREIGRPADEIRRLVGDWIERRPLAHMQACRFSGVDAVFSRLRARGIRLGVFSDYPVEAKLAALGLSADAVAYSLEPEIGWLKPHTAVLSAVAFRMSVRPEDCLVIGDREERDGACARALGAHFVCCSGRHFFHDLLATLDRPHQA